MKNKIYYLGIITTMLIIIGSMFKINHWPGAGILMLAGIFILCFLFLPVALYSSFKSTGKKRKTLYIAAYITLFVDFAGALFKVFHWPGANWMLIMGIMLPVILFLPVFLYFHFKEKEESLLNFMYIIFLLVFLSVMSALLSVQVSKNVIADIIRTGKVVDISDFLYKRRGIYHEKFNNNMSFTELKEKTNELTLYIDQLKKKLVLGVNQENRKYVKGNGSIELDSIKGKTSMDIVSVVLFGEQKTRGEAIVLKNAIKEYKIFLLKSIEAEKDINEIIRYLLSTKNVKVKDHEYSWEKYHFEHLPLVFVITHLNQIKSDVLLAESYVHDNMISFNLP